MEKPQQFSDVRNRRVTITNSGSCIQYVIVAENNGAILSREDGTFSGWMPWGRLELVPIPVDDASPARRGYLSVDFRTSRDEATEWMTFCLLQAGTLFQNTPSGTQTRDEMQRLIEARGLRTDSPEVRGALAFWDAIDEAHREMYDGDE